jgi:AbrB family looped-hinge helix DNA binding protein
MATSIKLDVNENGRVVIPVEFRKALGIKKGGQILASMEDEGLLITTIQRRIENAQRRAREYLKPGVSLVDELIAERREEAKRELE